MENIEIKIFMLLTKAPSSSLDIANELGRSIENINYHLKKLLTKGVIIKANKCYYVTPFITKLIKQMEK